MDGGREYFLMIFCVLQKSVTLEGLGRAKCKNVSSRVLFYPTNKSLHNWNYQSAELTVGAFSSAPYENNCNLFS